MLHASEPVGHRYPGKGTATPDRLLQVYRALPDLPVVLAHWGGGLPFYELMPEVAALTRNVVYDTAASTYLYRPAVFRTVLDVVGGRAGAVGKRPSRCWGWGDFCANAQHGRHSAQHELEPRYGRQCAPRLPAATIL